MKRVVFLISVAVLAVFQLAQTIVLPEEDVGGGSGRVVSGSSTDMGGWEFIASINEVNDPTCVGLLLSPINTLTTCQCVQYIEDISIATVSAGSVRRGSGMKRHVKQVQIHPQCSGYSIYQDISGHTFDYGIVQVNKSFEFNPGGILRARLPTWDFDKFEEFILLELDLKTTCTVAGWGATSITFPGKYQDPSTDLLTTEVELQDWEPCADRMCTRDEPHCYSAVLLTGKICARPIGKGNPCDYDWGGPLVCHGYIIAMVSQINSCGEYNEPNYYARIDVALPWISQFADQHDSAISLQNGLVCAIVTAVMVGYCTWITD